MKIYLTNLFCVFSILITQTLIAQPILTDVNTNPTTTDGYNYYDVFNHMSQGPSGPNVTWDFSNAVSLQIGNPIYTYSTVASTPYAADFNTSSNVCVYNNFQNYYTYYNVTPNALQYSGYANQGKISYYTDPWDIMHYPFTYNDSFQDTWMEITTCSCNTDTTYQKGKSIVKADGYGTLIGISYQNTIDTFKNVLRVFTTLNYTDSTISGTTTSVTHGSSSYYEWYLPCVHLPIYRDDNYLNRIAFIYYQCSTNSIDKNQQINSLISIYPNPTQNKFTIETTNTEKQNLQLFDVNGKLVLTQTINGTESIDVGLFSQGVYNVSIIGSQGVVNKRLVIVR